MANVLFNPLKLNSYAWMNIEYRLLNVKKRYYSSCVLMNQQPLTKIVNLHALINPTAL